MSIAHKMKKEKWKFSRKPRKIKGFRDCGKCG